MYTISYATTDLGRKRRTNEDRFVAEPELALFIIADGMGGQAASETIASIAVDAAVATVQRHADTLERIDAGEETADAMTDIGEEALLAACRAIYHQATSDEGQAGMGCTITAGDKLGSRGDRLGIL